MRRTLYPLTFLTVLLFVFVARATHSAELKPDPAQIKAIENELPPEPRGVGKPISDRKAWEALRNSPGFDGILQQAQRALNRPLPPMTDDVYLDYSRTGNRTRGQRVIRERHSRFALLALAECLENRGRFIPPMEEAIREVCGEKSWLLPAHDRGLQNYRGEVVEIDLNSAATSWNLATALYWLGNRLGEEIRELVRGELDRRTFKPFESNIETGKPRLWWVTGTNNWNAVCLACVVGASQASIDSPRRRAFFLAAAENSIRYFLRGFTPDGYCSEGLGYWNYGFGHYVLLAETLYQITSGRLDLYSEAKVREIARFGPRMEILPGIYPAFADCSTSARPDSRMMAFLSRRLSLPVRGIDPNVLKEPTLSLFSLGIYAFPNSASERPEVEAPPVALRDWFPDAGILICRNPGKERALGAALKGGHNAEHHNHNDVGSYVVGFAGAVPLIDPGAEVYTARTFSGRRYESKVLNSFGHPVPRVAGKLQRTGRRAAARVVKADFTDSADTLALDIGSAYDVKELEKLHRTFTFSREGEGRLTVTDEVEFTEPKEFETALITVLPWRKSGNHKLIIGKGPEAVEISIDTGGLEFSLDSEVIKEDVRGRAPTRLGIRFSQPAAAGTVRLTIQPVQQGKVSP